MKKSILIFIIILFSIQGYGQLEYYQGFRDGFKEGYCHGNPGCVAPAAPAAIAKPGERFFSYKDGYNNGYAAGMQARQSSIGQSSYQSSNRSSSNITSMYNADQEQQFINALVKRQAIFTQNKNYADDLISWINILKSQSSDQQFLNALENYRKKLMLIKSQDLSAFGNEIRQIDRGIAEETAKAVSRQTNSYKSSYVSNVFEPYKPGDLVITSEGGPFRVAPNSHAQQVEESRLYQIVKIIGQASGTFYEVEVNGRNLFLSSAFIYRKADSKQQNEDQSSIKRYSTESSVPYTSHTQIMPGDYVRTMNSPTFRSGPNPNSTETKTENKQYIVKIVRKVNDNYYQVEVDGANVFVSKAFLGQKVTKEEYESNIQNNEESIYDAALAAFESGKYEDARKNIEILLLKGKESSLIHFRGLTYLYEGSLDEAISDFSETIKMNPDDTACYYALAFTEYHNEDYKNALIHFTKYIQLDPSNYEAYYLRGMIKSELGDKRGAISDYDKIIVNSRNNIEKRNLATVLNNKAYCLVGLGDVNSALPIVNEALALEEGDWYIWDTRGEIYFKTNNFMECISDMTKAILIEENGNSFYYRGLAKIRLKIDGGCQDLSKAGELGKMEAYDAIKEFCNK